MPIKKQFELIIKIFKNKDTMRNWIGIVMLGLITLASCNPPKEIIVTPESKSEGILFIENQAKTYDEVLSLAQSEGKPVIVDFYTTWCAPCKWLEKDVFALKQVGDFYNQNFVNYKVNAEDFDGVELAQKFKVNGYPTIVFLNQAGQVINVQAGNTTASNFMNLGREAVQKNRMYSMVE